MSIQKGDTLRGFKGYPKHYFEAIGTCADIDEVRGDELKLVDRKSGEVIGWFTEYNIEGVIKWYENKYGNWQEHRKRIESLKI